MAQARRKSTTATRRRRARRSMHGWLMLAAGLAIGAVLSALVLGYPVGASWRLGSGLRSVLERDDATAAQSAPSPPAPESEQAGESPHFDFYTVLPEIEYVMPDEPPPPGDRGGAAPATPSPAPDSKPEPTAEGHYVLQAGSYADYGDADRMRARLALSGLEAYVQRVSIEGRGVFFRVRLGPFRSRGELNAANERLAREGIDALRIRVTRPAPG